MLVALAPEHVCPHAPQFAPSLLVFVHTLLHWVCVHTQAPPLQVGVGWVHAEPLTHCPVPLHVCGVFPVHCFELGTQLPVHDPALHIYGQTDPDTHRPVASQVCGVLLEHCVESGPQTPVHAPPEQTNGHVWPLVHCPVESQV